MKKLLLTSLLVSLLSCKSTNTCAIENKDIVFEKCPEDGTCTLVVLKNKKLNVLSDDLGSLYFSLSDNEATHVFHYQYKRNVPEDVQDGQHIEEVYFEINANETNLTIENEALQQTKMIFGRHCYCKGQAGFFKVNSGTLQVKKTTAGFEIQSTFISKEVPQIISSFSGTAK
ncbi:hypothetical protein [Flavobacterium orientale]|uniref:Lipoprotein n=1 Tax=Flavobacterium orientale TaxID=1756020 RepID=A0A916XX33_9FLAO|nr:hypothetical protein [Flavobacterium orientale]GGD18609.1 hypothetical protein GCM10011343_06520 [Flavobacterium orientale]